MDDNYGMVQQHDCFYTLFPVLSQNGPLVVCIPLAHTEPGLLTRSVIVELGKEIDESLLILEQDVLYRPSLVGISHKHLQKKSEGSTTCSSQLTNHPSPPFASPPPVPFQSP